MYAIRSYYVGADIELQGNTAICRDTQHLSGAQVMATDLRASASLVLAGFVAEGESYNFV